MKPIARLIATVQRAVVLAVLPCFLMPSPGPSVAIGPRSAAAADGDASSPLEFRRVHVPADRLSEVPLGTGRYVPMSAREFEEGIARLSPGAAASGGRELTPSIPPTADIARYDILYGPDGGLSGTVAFEIGSFGADQRGPREFPLGDLDVRTGTMQTASGTGEALVFGRQDGSISVATPQPGTYSCAFHRPLAADADGRQRLSLPMLPALASTVVLRLPRDLRPVINGGGLAVIATADESQPASDDPKRTATVAWRIETGPRGTLDVMLVPRVAPEQRLSTWTDVAIRGREALLMASVQPRQAWLSANLRLRKHVEARVTNVTIGHGAAGVLLDEASWRVVDDGNAIVVDLPARFLGSFEPLVVSAVAPLGPRDGQLPLVRSEDDAWVGGGIAIRISAPQSLESLALEHCMVVPPEAAARWPLPSPQNAMDAPAEGTGTDGVLPARVFIEEQSPQVAVMLALVPRTAAVDVARVTTVDLSPGLVVGRAACDVRVVRGEAFGLTARITPGWFIDSVEAVPPPAPGEAVDPLRRRDSAEQGLEWRMQRDARGDVLRIGLTSAATPTRGLALRVTGHRGGIALGEDFSASAIDMVRFDGESERSTLIELRTSPDTTVEFEGDEQLLPVSDARLAMLAEEGPVRGRVRGGHRAGARTARLVRRRPPLDVRTQVRVTIRDDRLTESFTFECQPGTSDLDSTVVHFSEPMDVPLEWSLLPPASGAISARRIDSGDGRLGQGGAPVRGDRWLVELAPAVRGPVTIRAVRTIPFTGAKPVPLACVDGATTTVGQVIVRDVGRSRPRLVNRRLSEIPPDLVAAQGGEATVAEFSYDFDAALGELDEPAVELLPNPDARAWAWREVTASWCYASGATEYETQFDIENQGRTSLALSLPPGRRLEAIVLDGARQSLGDRRAAGGDLRIELPAGRQFVRLSVRMVADAGGGTGAAAGRSSSLWERCRALVGVPDSGEPPCWRIEPAAVGIDVPVLQREWRLFLPPDIAVMGVGRGFRIVGDHLRSRDWAARLLGAGLRPTDQGSGAGSAAVAVTPGFDAIRLVPAGIAGADADIIVVRRHVLATFTVFAGLAAACAVFIAARFGSWPVLLLCLLGGVAALWCPSPVDGIARAAWWGAAAAALLPRVWRPLGAGRRTAPAFRAPATVTGLTVAAFILMTATTASAQTPDENGPDQNDPDEAVARARTPDVDDGRQAEPLRVFIMHSEGDRSPGKEGVPMALVPERLFQAIVRGEDLATSAPVRVLAARIFARSPTEADGGWGTWRLILDVDADEGGTLVLDQASIGAKFGAASASIDGVQKTGRLDASAGSLRITVAESGRHVVEVDVEPAVARRGETETATVVIPTTPKGTLQLRGATEATDRSGVVCELMTDRGVFAAAPSAGHEPDSAFDVSWTPQVRLVRSLVAGVGLAAQPKSVASRNEIAWNLDACRLTAAFDVDPGEGIVRAIEVVADPSLELIESAAVAAPPAESIDNVSVRRLDGSRYLVERRSPDRGRWRFELAFRRSLADPVGIFEVPAVWVDRADVDVRTVRLSASPSLAVRIDLPAGVAAVPIPEGEASFEARSWRGEVAHPSGRSSSSNSGARGATAATARPRLWVERRRQEIRGSQRLTVVFAGDAVRLHLDSRIDASATALVAVPLDLPTGCEIDRIELFEDDALHPETAERGAIDVRWTRGPQSGAVVVVQRPRAGRFRLEVDARLPGRPAAGGTLPCLRAVLGEGTSTLVDWRAEDGRLVRLRQPTDDGSSTVEDSGPRVAGQIKLHPAGTLPDYALEPASSDTRSVDQPGDSRAASPRLASDAGPVGSGRVELADIRLAVDERGRTWGLARFEMLAAERVVRLRLPPSWRLFDVSIDGRPAEGVVPMAPQDDNVWEFRLLDPGWPRSVVALFAGEVGRRLVDGEPFAIPSPQIIGLPCRNVIWTVHVPEWIALRVQEPARIVSAERLQFERRAAMSRLQNDFERAIDRMSGNERERMRGFFEARREGMLPDSDETWFSTSASGFDGFPTSAAVTISGDVEKLAIRAVRRADPTARGRALATLSLLACGGLVWLATLRGCPSWLPSPGAVLPWLAMITGMLWISMLTPAWFGAALVACGWGATAAGWWRHRRAGVHDHDPPNRVADAASGGGWGPAEGGSTTGFAPGSGAN